MSAALAATYLTLGILAVALSAAGLAAQLSTLKRITTMAGKLSLSADALLNLVLDRIEANIKADVTEDQEHEAAIAAQKAEIERLKAETELSPETIARAEAVLGIALEATAGEPPADDAGEAEGETPPQ